MKFKTAEIITGIIFLLYSVLYIFWITPTYVTNALNDSSIQTIAWTLRPEALPNLNIGAFIFFTCIMIIQATRSKVDELLELSFNSSFKLLFIIACSFIYVALLPIFGFLTISPLFMLILVYTLGLRDWRYIVGISLVMPFLMDFFFYQGFQIILPEGQLWK